MDETFRFLLSERKGEIFNYVSCHVLQQTVHTNIFAPIPTPNRVHLIFKF